MEDDQIIQLDLRRHLKQLDYVVVGAASSGEEAVTKAAELEPDLILMDIRLRGVMDGVEAANEIRRARAVPVLYLSAQSGDIVTRNGKDAAQPRITKPFKQAELSAAIEAALDGQQR